MALLQFRKRLETFRRCSIVQSTPGLGRALGEAALSEGRPDSEYTSGLYVESRQIFSVAGSAVVGLNGMHSSARQS